MSSPKDITDFCNSVDFDLLRRFDRNEPLTPDGTLKVAAALTSPVPYMNGGKLDVMQNPIFDLTSVDIARMSRNGGFVAAGYTPAAIAYITEMTTRS